MRSRLSRRLTLASVIVAALLGAAGAAYAAFVATTANGPSSLQATSSFPRCYRDAVNADNPVSHWKLNETSGTTAADSAGANNGTYAGGVTLAQPGALADPENKAPSFDGTNDQVVVSDAAGLRPAQISVEAWVKRASGTAQWASPVMKTSNDDWADGYGLYFTTDGNVHFFVNNWDLYDVATTLPADQWTHLVGTYDGATIKLYKNGAQVASLALTAPINHSTADLLIGNAAGDGYFWQSGIDEVAVYGSALSASRIQAHYNAGIR